MLRWINHQDSVCFRFLMSMIFLFLLGVTSCSSNKKKILEDTSLPTMKQVYQESFGHSEIEPMASSLRPVDGDLQNLKGSAKDISTALSQQFPKMKNPMLLIYIWPHKKGEAVIPGYYTQIPMFEKDQYLPAHLYPLHEVNSSFERTSISERATNSKRKTP